MGRGGASRKLIRVNRFASVQDQIDADRRWIDADRRWIDADRRWIDADRRWIDTDRRWIDTDRRWIDTDRRGPPDRQSDVHDHRRDGRARIVAYHRSSLISDWCLSTNRYRRACSPWSKREGKARQAPAQAGQASLQKQFTERRHHAVMGLSEP